MVGFIDKPGNRQMQVMIAQQARAQAQLAPVVKTPTSQVKLKPPIKPPRTQQNINTPNPTQSSQSAITFSSSPKLPRKDTISQEAQLIDAANATIMISMQKASQERDKLAQDLLNILHSLLFGVKDQQREEEFRTLLDDDAVTILSLIPYLSTLVNESKNKQLHDDFKIVEDIVTILLEKDNPSKTIKQQVLGMVADVKKSSQQKKSVSSPPSSTRPTMSSTWFRRGQTPRPFVQQAITQTKKI